MSKAWKPWTPEEDEIIRRYYPTGSWKACKKHLPHRTKKAIQARAVALEAHFGDVPGYINASTLARVLADNTGNIIRVAEAAGVVRRIRGRVLIREGWATEYIELRRQRKAAEEAREAGYLTTREVMCALRIGLGTAQRWALGQQSWLARRFGQPRIVRGKRGRMLWHPVDIEKVRVALEKERRVVREMKPVKAVALDMGFTRNGMTSRVARESKHSLLTLAGGRIVRFVE
ncbi:SANT/Myb-like DNA-binding domain-containing protein [Meiothermus ruber]|uniref:SANT/Myb-like DNA-binding domain-containing protein n=1 Tax=Meiothermus ruber TaxID=277 RepID=UPI00056AE08D|nr:SANT/Myb-like DNA-binding domain-containing protein [Meiothermus ruber]